MKTFLKTEQHLEAAVIARCTLGVVFALAASCATEAPSELTLEGGGGGKIDGQCGTVAANMAPLTAPAYQCTAPSAYHRLLMADVNQFWQSDIGVCGCGPDYPHGCEGATADRTGWVYANFDFIEGLRESGSDLPAAYVYAHEVGHMIQGYYNVLPRITQQKELEADCFAGYYLGSVICEGRASRADLELTLRTACVIADGTGDPITDLDTHGTCEQRVAAVALGIAAFQSGRAPIAACAR